MEEKMKKLGEMMEADEVFAKELYMQETAEEVQVLLKEKGLEFTLEELKQVYEATLKALEAEAVGHELSENDMEEVAGGYIPPYQKPDSYSMINRKPLINELTAAGDVRGRW
ncbi:MULTISPECIES: Nif11-like leader peptide family RiPP precursor [Anoxynatronum]|uniref:Nif11-like leader peptide domain-containing protein n=2 Tax=Anoxynatronum TaxID=210622 RepID=A0AA45WX81_9CLOT|nr:Nif11-like leader peptide family RiPP precursor [Anoxynatronum buryatiense]SMP57957.1 nif11-like leader peptide domain-containing protein [Anoxynatronum buryatiense]